ncbi:Crp/Fnr family transcriptional regulator [uncultured Sphingomonas sp.]|uniref:Crp/Fnr family transcriptional regulator n=1 Tax=uncultured Sphingomonas sp. TaxID=158754 RepID=UPI0025ECE14F|nr:Crp/Fnr family transcriptional regulator [uncultured Sphingomonas sp.]
MTISHRQFRRGTVVRAEHGPLGDIMVVTDGWLFSSALLEDGRRQIMRLHFRGDLVGLDGLAYDRAPDTISALTDAQVCLIDRVALGRMFIDHPRLCAFLFAIQQIDRVVLAERLISLGRSSAKGRVAALLMWIANRMQFANIAIDGGFVLPVTQEEIGDLSGLTAVHVNRTMRALADQGLIARSGTTLRILDMERLAHLANYSERRPVLDPVWLPLAD